MEEEKAEMKSKTNERSEKRRYPCFFRCALTIIINDKGEVRMVEIEGRRLEPRLIEGEGS